MKKIFKSLLLAASVAAIITGCSSDRSSILKVYNWSDYIDEDLIEEFEKWYKDCTGEEISVVYQTFDINETMLSKIEKGHEDYDVVCPSDYIIERMINQDLAIPIGDLDTVLTAGVPNYMKDSESIFFKNTFERMNVGGKNARDYAVGYMWGTTGLIYNPKFITEEQASSWAILKDPSLTGKILMKDAARDVYAQIIIYLRQNELAEGSVTLDELMIDSSEKSIADVEAFLADVKDNVAGWEADFGKDQMTQERAWISLNWSGDAVWAIEEAAEKGLELRYQVPDEGATYWFDGWLIPKYAKNIKAAKYWINYMCMPETAIRNMDATGYVSVNGDPSVLESQVDQECEPIDLTYFFGPGYDSVRVDPAIYPSAEIIEKCTFEHDWGENTHILTEFWGRVKGDNASSMTYIVIASVIVVLGAAIIYSKRDKRKRSRRRRFAGKRR